MGDIADDVISGFQCTWCGVCFQKEHGWPVVCFSCGKGVKKKELEKYGLQQATIKEI